MRFVLVFCIALSIASLASATVLYQGNGSSTPVDQGYFLYISGASTTNTTSGGVTTLNSTADNADQPGWGKNIFNGSFPTMDRTGNGYVVSLDMTVLAQNTTSNDRAGISLIALSSDHMGVEIAFFTNEVWAYNFSAPSTFTHGEGHALNTTAATTYDLAIHGSTYELFAGGNSILTGALRDYSPHGAPYTINNFIWLGDDTTESGGSFQFTRLEVNNATPEPASIFALAPALLALRRRR